MDNQKQQINIEITPEIAGGIYSNLALIAHSPSEFIIDFAQVMPGVPKPKVASRVILTPEHAKRLLKALMDNIEKYESENGKIVLRQGPMPVPPMGNMGEA